MTRSKFDICIAPFTTLYKISVFLNAIYGNMRLLFSLQKWLNHIKGYAHIGMHNVIFFLYNGVTKTWLIKVLLSIVLNNGSQHISTWEDTFQEFVLPYFTNLLVSIVDTLLYENNFLFKNIFLITWVDRLIGQTKTYFIEYGM